MWIGTLGGGLNHLNRITQVFTTFTEKEGLASNVVYAMLEDDSKNLWVSTNNGLFQFNTGNLFLATLTKSVKHQHLAQLLQAQFDGQEKITAAIAGPAVASL